MNEQQQQRLEAIKQQQQATRAAMQALQTWQQQLQTWQRAVQQGRPIPFEEMEAVAGYMSEQGLATWLATVDVDALRAVLVEGES